MNGLSADVQVGDVVLWVKQRGFLCCCPPCWHLPVRVGWWMCDDRDVLFLVEAVVVGLVAPVCVCVCFDASPASSTLGDAKGGSQNQI